MSPRRRVGVFLSLCLFSLTALGQRGPLCPLLFRDVMPPRRPFVPVTDWVAEKKFIEQVVERYRELAKQAYAEVAKPEASQDRSRGHYQRLGAQVEAPATVHDTLEISGETDTRVQAHLPVAGDKTVWAQLSPAGRILLARRVAELYSIGPYDPRPVVDTLPPGKAFLPDRLFGAAQTDSFCGECRLAANAVAAVLGELGVPRDQLLVVYNDHHQWILAELKPGEWWVIDPEPNRGKTPAKVLPLSDKAAKHYLGYEGTFILMAPQLEGSAITASPVRVRSTAEAVRALVIDLLKEQGEKLKPSVEVAMAQFGPSLSELDLSLARPSEKLALATRPELQALTNWRPSVIRLDFSREPAAGYAAADLVTGHVKELAASPLSGALDGLRLQNGEVNDAALAETFQRFPNLSWLSLHDCRLTGDFWPQLLVRLKTKRLESLMIAPQSPSEDQLTQLLTAAEKGELQLGELDLRDSALSKKSIAMVRAWNARKLKPRVLLPVKKARAIRR